MNNTETLVDVAISDGFDGLAEIKGVGSEQYKIGVEGVTKLLDRKIEMARLEMEHAEKEQARKDQRADQITKNVLTGVSVVGGLALTVWGALMSWKFEETGTITTTAGKKFMGNLFWKK